MKDEIKEILDKLKDKDWYEELDLTGDKWIELKQTETKQILDYITNLQEENEEIKMTNLALADDITKNKIIKQEVLTECCGISIGEIPMLKIQNDEYKQRIDKAIEYIESYLDNTGWLEIGSQDVEVLINLLQGKSDE